MKAMNISLPDPLKRFVDKQLAGGRYSSVSEYVRELIRLDQQRKAKERFEGLLLAGMGAPPSDLSAWDWKQLRRRVRGSRRKRPPKKTVL